MMNYAPRFNIVSIFSVVNCCLIYICSSMLFGGCSKEHENIQHVADSSLAGYCSANIDVAEATLRHLNSRVESHIAKFPYEPGVHMLHGTVLARLSLLLAYRGQDQESDQLMKNAVEAMQQEFDIENKGRIATQQSATQMIEYLDARLVVKWKSKSAEEDNAGGQGQPGGIGGQTF